MTAVEQKLLNNLLNLLKIYRESKMDISGTLLSKIDKSMNDIVEAKINKSVISVQLYKAFSHIDNLTKKDGEALRMALRFELVKQHLL